MEASDMELSLGDDPERTVKMEEFKAEAIHLLSVAHDRLRERSRDFHHFSHQGGGNGAKCSWNQCRGDECANDRDLLGKMKASIGMRD